MVPKGRPDRPFPILPLALLAFLVRAAPLTAQEEASGSVPEGSVIALVGATVTDGNGGPAAPDQTIVVRGKRIEQIGPRRPRAPG